MKNLFLHIGPRKTGSSTIQAFLRKNKRVLLSKGYLYPSVNSFQESDSVESCSSSFLEMAQNAHHKYALQLKGRKGADKAFAGIWDKLNEEIDSKNVNNIILSSECFESSNKNYVRQVKAALEQYNVKVIVYVRRQDLRLESSYTQATKTGRYVGSLQSFVEKRKKKFDYSKLLKVWSDLFGIANLIVRPLEKTQIPDICTDFLKTLGIDDYDDFQKIENVNSKPGLKTLKVFKFVNKSLAHNLKLGKEGDISLNELVERYKDKYAKPIQKLTKTWEQKQSYRLLPYSNATSLIEYYEESNSQIARKFLNRLDSPLFYEGIEVYEYDNLRIDELEKQELSDLIDFFIKLACNKA